MTAEVIDLTAARFARLMRDHRRLVAEAVRLHEEGRRLAEALKIALAERDRGTE